MFMSNWATPVMVLSVSLSLKMVYLSIQLAVSLES